MKLLKKFTATIVAMSMALSIMPVMTIEVAAEGGAFGDDFTWDFDGTKLTISGTGEMPDWEGWDTPWIDSYYEIQEVEITGDVESIGNYAFAWCDSLTSVTIPDTVTRVGDYAFAYCNNLSSADIPNDVTYIGDFAFCSCNLNYITIPETVVYIGDGAFQGCSYASGAINVPDSVTYIGDSAFASCNSIDSIHIGKGVEYIGDAALSGSQVANIDVDADNESYTSDGSSLFDKEKKVLIQYAVGKMAASYTIPNGVTSIGKRAFDNADHLTSITIPEGVVDIGDSAFSWCYSLKSVVIPNTVVSIDTFAFSNCWGLEDLTIGSGVTSIGEYAFYVCSKLKSVNIPANVTDIGVSAFAVCEKLTEFKVDEANPNYSSSDDGHLFNKDKTTFISYAQGKGGTEYSIPAGVTEIAESAFDHCEKLTKITIPEGVTTIQMSAFLYCSGLTDVKLPDGLTELEDSAFEGCSSLKEMDIPDNVSKIGANLFRDCTSLTRVTLGKSADHIHWYAFYNCTNLTDVTIPKSVKLIRECVFEGCEKLTNVYFGGCEDMWKAIEVYDGNENLAGMTIHYSNDHDWSKWKFTKEPTKTDSGEAKRACTYNDSDYQTVTVPSLSDTNVWTEGEYTAPTCDDDGSQEYTSEEYGTVTETVPKMGHDWGEWTITKEPTCSEAGQKQRICNNDKNHVDNQEIPQLPVPTEYSVNFADGKAVVTSPEAGTCTVIFAAYKNGALTSFESKEITFTQPDVQSVIPQTFSSGDADMIKIMLWGDLINMNYLCTAYSDIINK